VQPGGASDTPEGFDQPPAQLLVEQRGCILAAVFGHKPIDMAERVERERDEGPDLALCTGDVEVGERGLCEPAKAGVVELFHPSPQRRPQRIGRHGAARSKQTVERLLDRAAALLPVGQAP